MSTKVAERIQQRGAPGLAVSVARGRVMWWRGRKGAGGGGGWERARVYC